MHNTRLTVFLSSRMQELHDERILLKQVLEEKGIQVFAFEEDAGARPEAPQVAYLSEVESADIYVGLFWNEFSGPVFEEFQTARSLKKPCFVYVKNFAVRRDERLNDLLRNVSKSESGLTWCEFSNVVQLGRLVSHDLQSWLIRDWRLKCGMSGSLRALLLRDADDMIEFVRTTDDIEIDRVDNWPPTYDLRFRMKGILSLDPSGHPVFGQDHRLRMELHKDYPMSLPFVRFTTSLFHPNVYEEQGSVCLGWFPLPYRLPKICIHIARMIDYQIYQLHAPVNCEAARWAKANQNRFPLANWQWDHLQHGTVLTTQKTRRFRVRSA